MSAERLAELDRIAAASYEKFKAAEVGGDDQRIKELRLIALQDAMRFEAACEGRFDEDEEVRP